MRIVAGSGRRTFLPFSLTPISSLASPAEKEFRFALDVLHAGQTTPDRLALLLDIDVMALTPAVYRRLVALWRRDAEKLAVIAPYLREVEAARDWHADRSKNLERALAERLTNADPGS